MVAGKADIDGLKQWLAPGEYRLSAIKEWVLLENGQSPAEKHSKAHIRDYILKIWEEMDNVPGVDCLPQNKFGSPKFDWSNSDLSP